MNIGSDRPLVRRIEILDESPLMAFPDTRHSLIHRIAKSRDEDDWRQFLADYWRPICRFASRRGQLTIDDAEDVASATLEALVGNNLLERWLHKPNAKLRTLICAVVRNILSNGIRVQEGRKRFLRDRQDVFSEAAFVQLGEDDSLSSAQTDEFYGMWAEELLNDVIDALMNEYYQAGKGDCFRTLYGRICEGMSTREIAEALNVPVTTVENYYKRGRKRLGEHLERHVRQQVERYCQLTDAEEEYEAEWRKLGEFLSGCGGLEAAIRKSYESIDSVELRKREATSVTTVFLTISKQA